MRSSGLLRSRPAFHRAAVAAALASALVSGEGRAATQQFFVTGAVASSSFSPLPAGAPFAGHYLFDDATVDTDGSAGTGAYATGLFHVDWGPAIGQITFDQLPGILVRNDAVVFFGCSDIFSLTAGEGARNTPGFGNATLGGSGVNFQDFSIGCVPAPDALAGDTLTGVPQVVGPPWSAGDQNLVVGFSAVGGGCPPFISSCFTTMAIATLVPAFQLTVVKTGNGDGTVVSDPFAIDCGGVCTALVGGSVELIPTASVGSRFDGWTGCDSLVGDHCLLDVTSDREVEARFQIISPLEIPTVSRTGLVALALGLSLLGWLSIRRSR